MSAGERIARVLVFGGMASTAAGVWLLAGPAWGLFASGLIAVAAGLFAVDID